MKIFTRVNQIIKTPINLYDGFEDGFYDYVYNIRIENKFIVIPVIELVKNTYYGHKNIKQENAIEELDFYSSDGKSILLAATKCKSDNLRVYHYYLSDIHLSDYLFLFAMGEFQPARYKIYLESIWKYDYPIRPDLQSVRKL